MSYVTRTFELKGKRGSMKLTDGLDGDWIRSIHVPDPEHSRGRRVTARRFRAAFALCGALCSATAVPLAVQAVPAGVNPAAGVAGGTELSSSQWVTRPPLRQARGGLGVATVDGQILAISGFDFHEGLYDVVEARPQTGTASWHDLAPLPTARGNLATAELGGLVYAVGGLRWGGSRELDVVETFDPTLGRWATSLPLPQPRGGPGAASLDGRLYVAGGRIFLGGNRSLIANSVVAYDPETNVWKSVAPMPTARERHRLVASGRHLYAIGGLGLSGQSLRTVERYDPKSNSWRTMNPMFESRVVPCAVATKVGTRSVLVVVAGVEFSNGAFVKARRNTEVFDLEDGRWTVLDVLLPGERGSHDCAVETDGTVLAIGGFGNTSGGPSFVSLANVDALALTSN
jgi:hypothetical protein